MRPGHVARFDFSAWSLAALSCYNLTVQLKALAGEPWQVLYPSLFALKTQLVQHEEVTIWIYFLLYLLLKAIKLCPTP